MIVPKLMWILEIMLYFRYKCKDKSINNVFVLFRELYNNVGVFCLIFCVFISLGPHGFQYPGNQHSYQPLYNPQGQDMTSVVQ